MPANAARFRRYIGVPIVDQTFSKAYLRFTDDSAADIERELHTDGVEAVNDAAFVATWDKLLPGLAPSQSLRTMMDWLSSDPRPYFYALMEGDRLGAFDVLIDPRRDEQVTFGQPHLASNNASYDVWASFRSRDAEGEKLEAFVPVSYAVDSTIHDDFSISGQDHHEAESRAGRRARGAAATLAHAGSKTNPPRRGRAAAGVFPE